VITPDTPDRLYSTRLRTALVLTGSGTGGAYHAGVLRALYEAGVRTDLVAGRGMGAASAIFAAVDGAAGLWEPGGLWKGRRARAFYRWRAPLRVAGWAIVASLAVLLFPVALLAVGIAVGLVGFLLTLIGFERAGSAVAVDFTGYLGTWFTPAWLPTLVPRLVLLGVLVAVGALMVGLAVQIVGTRVRRRTRGGLLWRLVSSPVSVTDVLDAVTADLWKLIRGAAPLQRPRDAELGRRYVELLGDNLGQPGFRELLVLVHDLDARHDLVFAFLHERYRGRFFGARASTGAAPRGSEAFDLAGVARDHAVDALAAAFALPVASAPHLTRFSAEGPWRGERHRLCDRPGALARVLEEVLAAGVEQVILVSPAARPARAHELSRDRVDLRGSVGEQLAAFESAGLRDVLEQFAGRFTGLYVIRPDHNPLGPLDFHGVHDDRSDRHYALAELVDRGYEDAYRQFIDPIVGAGGERIDGAHADNRGAVRGIEL
jgi:hypothetical protein